MNNKKSFILTNNEEEVMEIFWFQGRSLSRSEIIELSEGCSWKKSTIHILLNGLLEKGAIKVDGFVKTGKNYGRTFSANLTWAEYQIMQFNNGLNYNKSKSSAIEELVYGLVQDEDIDDETIERLEDILKKRKEDKK